MCVCECRSNVLFIDCCNVFLGVPVGSVGEGPNDVQSVFCFSVDVVCVLFERHSTIECNSKDGGCVGVGDRVVE